MALGAEVFIVTEMFPDSLKYASVGFTNVLVDFDLVGEHLEFVLVSSSLYLSSSLVSLVACHAPGLVDQAAPVAILGKLLACSLLG